MNPLKASFPHLLLVHRMQGILGQRRTVGNGEINGAYHSDDAISSDVINKTKLFIHVAV